MAEPAPEGAPDWATDLVITEVRRAYPATVAKSAIVERTGLGEGALREVITALEEDGQIVASRGEAGDGWRYLEVEERPIGAGDVGDAEEDGAPEGEETPDDAVEGTEEPRAAAEALPDGTHYSVRVAVDVRYLPELREGEDEDDGAVREAELIRDALAAGLLASYPDLFVAAKVERVDAYDRPRRVR